jgi:hypothetical protein
MPGRSLNGQLLRHLGGLESELISLVRVGAGHDLGVIQTVVLEARLGLFLGLAVLALHAHKRRDEACRGQSSYVYVRHRDDATRVLEQHV